MASPRNQAVAIVSAHFRFLFSFLRKLTTWHCPHSLAARPCCCVPGSNRSIYPYPPGPQQQTCSGGETLHRCIDQTS